MSNTIKVSVPADDIDALDAARAFFEQVHSARGQAGLSGELYDQFRRAHRGPDPHTAGTESGDAEMEDDVTGAVLRPEDPQPAQYDAEPAPEPEPDSTAVDLDKDGLPWDARIHASTKKKTQDGRWKKKRNVDDETRQQVEAELRQLMDAPTPGSSSEPSGAAAPPPPPADGGEGEPSGAAPPPPPAAEPAASGEDMDFPTFLEHVGGAVADQRISWERVNELCSEVTDGAVTKSALLSARTDLIPSVWTRIRQELGGNG